MRLAAIFFVAGGLVCAHLTVADAEPREGPTTAPSGNVDERLQLATRQEDQAKAALERIRNDRGKQFDQSTEAAELRADVDAKQRALLDARRNGSPQERLDASSAYNAARQKLEKRRNDYLAADDAVAAADRAEQSAEAQVDAVRKEIDAERAAAAAAERSRQIEAYLACKRFDERLPELTSIPIQGDETPIAAVVADPWKFVGRPIVVCGAVEVADYFSAPYEGAKLTHFSFSFQQLDPGAALGNHAMLYVRRGLGDDIADACAAATAIRSGAMKVVRARVMIAPERASSDQIRGDMLEVLDWQFLAPGGAGWSAWASEVHPQTPAEQLARLRPRQPKLRAQVERAEHGGS